ncbi:unnamed protein product [Mortierella alpina]
MLRFKGCDSLNRLRFCADDDFSGEFYTGRTDKKELYPLVSTIVRQHYLMQLELNTRLVWHRPEAFLSAFLALQQLSSLRVFMTVQGSTISTALVMAMDLLNKHPQLEAILFGDWRCSQDPEDLPSAYSDDRHGAFSDDDDVEDRTEDEEMETFNGLEHQLRPVDILGLPDWSFLLVSVTYIRQPSWSPFSALACPTFGLLDYLWQKQQ